MTRRRSAGAARSVNRNARRTVHKTGTGKRAGTVNSRKRGLMCRGHRSGNRPDTRLVAGNAGLWQRKAFAAGSLAASTCSLAEEGAGSRARLVNDRWHAWYRTIKRLPWPLYHAAASRFAAGFGKGWNLDHYVWLPTQKRVAAVLTVMNEKETIPSVLAQLSRIPLHEIIIVVNGSNDGTLETIRRSSQAIIVHYCKALGHDVGRAIGAKLAEADILLFLDGDFPIMAEQLMPFVDAIERGYDIALNDLSPYIGVFAQRDVVTAIKEFVNRSLARPDLGANSLTAIPHAIRKEAAEKIGYANLSVPPKAQAIAIGQGLKVCAPASVNVIASNRLRGHNVGRSNAVADLIIGDHIEALRTALHGQGKRLSYADRVRDRSILES